MKNCQIMNKSVKLDSTPFQVTKIDESRLKSQNVYEPVCIRPTWVDYLYIPPPHKRLPEKDCLGRVQWLNKPVRKQGRRKV